MVGVQVQAGTSGEIGFAVAVDQGLGQAVPAEVLVQIRPLEHPAILQRQPARSLGLRRDLGQHVLLVDAIVEAVGVLALDGGVDARGHAGDLEGRSAFDVRLLLAVGPSGEGDQGDRMGDQPAEFVGRSLGLEVEDAADLAAAVGDRRRALDHFDIVGRPHRGREVARVLDAPEAAEEIVGEVAAHLQFTGHAEIVAGESSWRDVDEVVDVADAVEADDRRLDQGDRPRRLLQGQRQPEDAAGLAIRQDVVEVVALGRDGDLADHSRIVARRHRMRRARQHPHAERRGGDMRQQQPRRTGARSNDHDHAWNLVSHLAPPTPSRPLRTAQGAVLAFPGLKAPRLYTRYNIIFELRTGWAFGQNLRS